MMMMMMIDSHNDEAMMIKMQVFFVFFCLLFLFFVFFFWGVLLIDTKQCNIGDIRCKVMGFTFLEPGPLPSLHPVLWMPSTWYWYFPSLVCSAWTQRRLQILWMKKKKSNFNMKHILKGNVRGEYKRQKKQQINQFINLCHFKFNSLDTDAPPYGASAVRRHTRMRHLLAHQH